MDGEDQRTVNIGLLDLYKISKILPAYQLDSIIWVSSLKIIQFILLDLAKTEDLVNHQLMIPNYHEEFPLIIQIL